MAQFGKDADSFSPTRTVRIPRTESRENYTVYVIEVNVGCYTWTVEHRYSDFHELHDKLVSTHRLDKTLLPKKKVFGNQNDAFIKKRQADLESYLQTILYYVAPKIPPLLASFLEFEEYEIHGLTHSLAEELYNKGESILQLRETYTLSALQLYALTERLKLPEPTCDSGDVKKDLGHILDFITRLKYLKVYGSNDDVGTSNINMNKLTFDLTLFKSLEYVEILNCSATAVKGLETVKQTLQTLSVHNTLKDIREILLPDARHWKAEDGTLVVSYWDSLEQVDISHNSITFIDESIQMVPNVERLDLSRNQIREMKHFQWLSQLTYLDLSHNMLDNPESLHTKLGNLKTLKLAGNKLTHLQAFSKLFSLETLDISHNDITKIEDVAPVNGLPCLENLLLRGNPVTMVLDYRTKVFELFADRVTEVCLDMEKASQKEQDTVAVLVALQKAKNSKERAKQIKSRKNGELSDVAYSCTPPKLTGEPVNLSSSAPLSSSSHYSITNHAQNSAIESLEEEDVSTQQQNLEPMSELDQDHKYSTDNPILNEPSEQTMESNPSSEATDSKLYEGPKESKSDDHFHECAQKDSGDLAADDISVLETEVSPGDGPEEDATVLIKRMDSQENNSIPNRHDRLSGIIPSLVEPSVVPPQNILNINKKRKRLSVVNMTDLPCLNNTDFTKWLSQQLLSSGAEWSGAITKHPQDPILDIMWCKVIQFSHPKTILSCCCVLTKKKLYIEALNPVESSFEDVPDFHPVYILTLCNINQFIIGPCFSYLRFEEGFVKHMGTFTLIGLDNKRVQQFAETFKANSCDVHGLNSPDILDLSQDSDLTQLIFMREDATGVCSDRIVFSTCVTQKTNSLSCFLFLSECKVYLLPIGSCHWPWPNYDSENYESPKLDILQEFDIMARISDIRMYQETEKKINSEHIRCSMFGLSMIFQETVSQNFDILFPSMSTRDFFLERLTNLRAEFAHRMSPTFREEPDGGSEPDGDLDPRHSSLKRRDVCSLPSSFDISKYYVQNILPNVQEEGKKPLNKQLQLEIPEEPLENMSQKSRDSELTDSGNSDSFGLLSTINKSKIQYLSATLEDRLKQSVRNYNLCKHLPTKLKPFALMDGRDLASFFHENIAKFGTGEELRRVLWTTVIAYSNPKDEMVSLVLFSTTAIYVLADKGVPGGASSRPPWMNHNRHKSHSAFAWKTSMGADPTKSRKRGFLKPLFILKFMELHQVNVGLFDQCIRLTGQDENSVFTLVTRDGMITEILLEEFKSMLSLMVSSPMVDKSDGELEQDFYQAFTRRTKSTVEGLEYTHPSQVRFCYPGEDLIQDILYLIRDEIQTRSGSSPLSEDQVMWVYMLVFVTSDDVDQDLLEKSVSRTLILTGTHVCLAMEDIVTYPLPDFVRGLPETPRQEVVDVWKIINLKRVILCKRLPQLVQLVFTDEPEEIVVDVTLNHFSSDKGIKNRAPLPEVSLSLLVQSSNERSKFLQLLQKNWKELLPKHEVGRILDMQTID